MKTSRNDIERNKRKVDCKNSSWLGYSSRCLRYGDFFLADGKLAKCHGQVRPLSGGCWFILAQVASPCMQYSMERWIDPEDVTQVIPADKCRATIVAFFNETEDFFG